jgi:hypothetical protein
VITPTSDSTIAARLGIVDEHVRLENAHDLDGIMGTFGKTARYDDELWGSHYMGRQEVRVFYAQLLCAIPDLHIDIQRRHVGEEAVGGIWEAGAGFPQRAAKSNFRYAASLPSMRAIS